MRSCPQCKRAYDRDDIAFCLDDGAQLVDAAPAGKRGEAFAETIAPVGPLLVPKPATAAPSLAVGATQPPSGAPPLIPAPGPSGTAIGVAGRGASESVAALGVAPI